MSVYKSKDGRWYYRCYYTDLLGKRKQRNSKLYDTKKECMLAESQFKLDSSQTHVSSITLEELMLNYVDYSSQNTTQKVTDDKITRMRYMTSILNKKVDDITPNVMKIYRDELSKVDVGYARKNQILALISSAFKHGIKFYGLQNNPCAYIEPFKAPTSDRLKESNIYTPKQFNAFLSAIPSSKREYRNLYYILYWTGMRRTEALSITFEDYDENYIYLSKQYIHGKWATLKTKGSKRKIAIDEDIYNILQEQYDKYKDYEVFDKSWFVFGGYNQLVLSTVEYQKNQAIEKANLPYIRIHDLRHSHASYLIEQGVNMYKISKRLGHSSISITMDRYGHLLDEGDEILNAIKQKKTE